MTIGESITVFGNWFFIKFIENPGMAFGLDIPGKQGKPILTIFRIIAVIAIGWYLRAANDEQLLGLLKTRQIAVIPARVDYSIDLSAMSRQRLAWDAAAKRLDVLLPPIAPGPPNLDEARAQYLREGVWISRTTQDKLTRENTEAAERQASQEAVNPVLMSLARAAAKDAVRQNLSIPLEVAGYDGISVNVRFDGEKEAP